MTMTTPNIAATPGTTTHAVPAPTVVSQQVALTSETFVRTLERAVIAVATGTAASLSPAMGHVKWIVADGRTTVESTNAEIGVRLTVDAETRGDGVFTLPGRLALDLAKGFPTGPVVLAHDAATRTTRIAAEIDPDYMDQANIITHLRGYEPNEIVAPPPFEGVALFGIPSNDLLAAIGQVAPCASERSERAMLTGLCLRYTGDSLVFYTADGWRMARRVVRLDGARLAADRIVNLLTPASLLARASGLLPHTDALTEIASYPAGAPSHLVLRAEGVQVASRLMDGPYVNAEQLVPRQVATTARVTATRLAEAIRRSGYFVGTVDHKPIKLAIAPSSDGSGAGSLTVSAENDPGDSTSKIVADVTGSAITVVLNTRYISDAIKGAGTDQIEIGLNAATKPVVVRPIDGDDLVYVMAPINPTAPVSPATAERGAGDGTAR